MKRFKQYKILSLILAIILCCFFSTIAYSAIYSTMEISGLAYARVVKDVRVTDFKLSSVSENVSSSYEEFGVNTISTKFNLSDSSSSIVFDVEVTNYGSADVGILQLIGTVPTGLSYEIINYNLKDKICDATGKCNQMAVKTFQIKFTGTPGEYELTQELDFRTYHKVTYTDITNNNYPTEVIDGGDLSVTFTENLKRVSVLVDGTEVNYYESISSGQTISLNDVSGDIEIRVNPPVVKLVSGDLNTVGSEVCIKDECFYIISNDGSTVAMLAKYNLYVGGQSENFAWTPYGDEATGKQDPTMLGWESAQSISNGVTVFSSINYWYSNGLKAEYGTSFPVYVYDSNSTLYNYVENYKNYLGTLGVTLNEARLITYEELISLGCNVDAESCSEAPDWVYTSAYWSGSANTSHFVWFVHRGGTFFNNGQSINTSFGCRPVIEISVEDIYVPPAAEVISGDYDTVGSEVAIGDEHFYVISSTDDAVTMLAKYNLYVGNSFNYDSGIVNALIATGKQDSTALGFNNNPIDDMVIGVTAFSNDSQKGTNYSDYSGSIIEDYVNEYNNYLATLGIKDSEARLISVEELENLGCSKSTNNCNSTYPWVYLTSYWTGTAYDTESVYILFSENRLSGNSCILSKMGGVRPVITLSKSNF